MGLLDLPEELVDDILNTRLSNADQARAALACRRMRQLVAFRNVECSHPEILAASLGGCQAETLNVAGNRSVHILDLSSVGRDFPDRVARLRHVRVSVTGCWPFGTRAPLPASVFPALKLIAISSEFTNPVDPADERFVYDFVAIVAQPIRESMENLARAMRGRVCRRVDVYLKSVPNLFDCAFIRSLGLRVGRLNMFTGTTTPAHALAPAIAALTEMAKAGVGCFEDREGQCSLAVVRHFSVDTVRVLMLTLGAPGLLVALEARFSAPSPHVGLALTLSSDALWLVATMDDQEVGALARLAARGILESLAIKGLVNLPSDAIARILANVPTLRELTVSVTLEGALALAARGAHARIKRLGLCLLNLTDNPDRAVMLATLGTLLRGWPSLRRVSVYGSRDRLAYAGFVDALTADPPPPALRSVSTPGLEWTHANVDVN